MTQDQATFFDRIYPSISQRLQSLEDDRKYTNFHIIELKHEIKVMNEIVKQYKKKIQKIEQLLIEHGLKNLLEAQTGERNGRTISNNVNS